MAIRNQVSLISVSKPELDGIKDAEHLITYCARVSNPKNQDKEPGRLLAYLIEHGHWSPFEMVSVTLGIRTSRAISAQIIRHRSFAFQEFSQRYSPVPEITDIELRKQAETNRQSSSDVMDNNALESIVDDQISQAKACYRILINNGVAREQARMVLPMASETNLYMSGTLRSWIHYIKLRTKEDTQKEHREIAIAAEEILASLFPNVWEAINGQA